MDTLQASPAAKASPQLSPNASRHSSRAPSPTPSTKLKPLLLVERGGTSVSGIEMITSATDTEASKRGSLATNASLGTASQDRPQSQVSLAVPNKTRASRLQEQEHDNPSEQWTSPADAEGALVRKTYAYFGQAGISGDGFVEGKEFTRHRSEALPWEKSKQKTSQEPSQSSELGAGSVWGEGRQEHLAPKEHDPHLSTGSSVPSARHTIESTEEAVTSATSHTTPEADESKDDAIRAPNAEQEKRPEGGEQEAQMEDLLGRIDRYGFFSSNVSQKIAQGRVTSLSSEGFKKLPSKRPALKQSKGPVIAPSSPPSPEDEIARSQSAADQAFAKRGGMTGWLRKKEDVRIGKWEKMMVPQRSQGQPLTRFTLSPSVSASRLRRRIFKGIPDRWRAAAWEALLERRLAANKGKQVQRQHTPSTAFIQSLAIASPHDVQIDLDVPRTISGHILFHTRYGLGQRNLFHVLHAFSLRCDDCAYCQGMGPIGATLLCYLIPETAYSFMVAMHDSYDLHKIFSPGFPGLVELFYVQNSLMKRYMPRLQEKLEGDMITSSSYATKWYITMFNGTVPFETQLRIWDAFFHEGPDVLVVAAIAILWNLQARLLHPSATFEYTLGALSSLFIPENDDAFMLWICNTLEKQDVRLSLASARREWVSLNQAGNAASLAL